MIKDRRDCLLRIKSGTAESPVILDLGCGERKCMPTAIGIDLKPYEAVDVVGDVFDVLAHLPDASVDQIRSSHFFEHLNDVPRLLSECVRVLRHRGDLRITVPHHSNPFFYSDPTHRTFFGLYTFAYYAEGAQFSRQVPGYSRVPGLRVLDTKLVFKSYRPRYLRHAFKRVIQAIVNTSAFNQELYEEFFCFWIPCSEIEVWLTRAEPL